MTGRLRRLAALTAGFAPGAAGPLLALVAGAPAAEIERGTALARASRTARLEELAAAFGCGAERGAPGEVPGSTAWRRLVRDAPLRRLRAADAAAVRETTQGARVREQTPRATGMHGEEGRGMRLPFALPTVSRGRAALTPAALEVGRAASTAAATALEHVLEAAVTVRGTPQPAPAAGAVGTATAFVALEALGVAAAVELDARFLARMAERLAGSPLRCSGALVPTELEQSVLDLLVLAAIDALPEEGASLAPRLALAGEAAPDALVVALDMSVGDDRGRGRLLLPAPAVVALAGPPELSAAVRELAIPTSFRSGTATLAPDEVALLAPGDVLLLDDASPRHELVLPGGLRVRGRLEESLFHAEEIAMTETQASYPISLSVEIGRVTLTIGELARLEPGAVLDLRLPGSGAVVLRAGERAIARGELVEIDGTCGVRLTQVGELP